MAGERASSVPIQLVADPASPTKPPEACANGGGTNQGSLALLGANGILGVAFYIWDCGPTCVTDPTPGLYFGCASSGCAPTTVPLEKQLANPIADFAADNNGYSITLPDVEPAGSPNVSGSLTFGIGTRANNVATNATILLPKQDGSLTTIFQGKAYGGTLLDSGSNAFFFLNPTTSGFPTCRVNNDFYCPPSTVELSTLLVGADGTMVTLPLPVANADQLLSGNNFGFDDLAGPNTPNLGFLWGLPTFYRRTVFFALLGRKNPNGTGPYWAL
jgi:hypothetical protein